MASKPRRDALTPSEIESQQATDLPDREAMSLLDTALLNLDVNLDAALDVAAPVNAAAAVQANAGVPIDAAVSANVLSNDSAAVSSTDQTSGITQLLQGNATATADQGATVDQSGD
jgi:hypothetical protein